MIYSVEKLEGETMHTHTPVQLAVLSSVLANSIANSTTTMISNSAKTVR
jgi:hypothetical protein